MAKKTVATLHEGSKDGRAYTKVIKMVKSPKTGAYIFDEQMVPNLVLTSSTSRWFPTRPLRTSLRINFNFT